jgi:hypothetical protein
MKKIYNFFRLWIQLGDFSEAWQDAKMITDFKFQEEMKALNIELDSTLMNTDNMPCHFDHNGECLICDCWPPSCAYLRMLNKDYRWESKEELEKMFKDHI